MKTKPVRIYLKTLKKMKKILKKDRKENYSDYLQRFSEVKE